MKQLIRSAAFLLAAAIAFSACTSVPDHARYIPADALVVIGVNTKQMSREIAWNAIAGSKILDELNKDNEKQAAKELDHSGIDWMSTSYAYVKTDPDGKNIVAAVLPLENKAEWETFIKKQFAGISFKQANGRTDARLDLKLYAGWTDRVLIVMSVIPAYDRQEEDMGSMIAAAKAAGEANGDTTVITEDFADSVMTAQSAKPAVPETSMPVMMDSAFAITKEHSILQDKRFTKLEKQGHDITMWVNYEHMMDRYMGNSMAKTMGLSLSNTLWKGSAMASGIDFRKGKITADMLYYTSGELKEISRELSGENADRDMIDRLPAQNMNMMMAWHMSPKGTKGTLEKAGFLGFINMALMSVGLSADDIFDTFTGDMAVSVCNFAAGPQIATASDSVSQETYTTHADYVYVMKIAKKENLAKLLGIAVSKEILRPAGNNMYQLAGESANSFVLAHDDKYLVAANKAEAALAYLQGKNKGAKLPEAAQTALYGHPAGGYFDIAALTRAMNLPAGTNTSDAALADEAKKLVTDINFYGGDFNGDAFESHATANFTNKEENGLLQLLQFAVKAKKLADEHHSATAAMAAGPADTVSVK